MRNIIHTVVIVLQVVSIVLLVLYVNVCKCHRKDVHHKQLDNKNKQCSKDFCGASDPVTEPAYNMKSVVMQSILLEEHMAEDKKYCKQCCVKHFLHIMALCEEALMMAGKDQDKYPLMKESLMFYDKAYNKWNDNKDDDKTRTAITTGLREWRKKIMEEYLF